MNLIGNWIDRVDTEEGLKQYESFYEMSPYQMIVDYELFNLTRLFPDKKRHIVFLEYDGEINQVMSLEDHEHLMIYSQGCCGGIFNSEGQAFIKLIRDCKQVAMWYADNSPYDLTDEDWEDDMDEVTKEEVLDNLNELLKEQGIKHLANDSNVLFVRQL